MKYTNLTAVSKEEIGKKVTELLEDFRERGILIGDLDPNTHQPVYSKNPQAVDVIKNYIDVGQKVAAKCLQLEEKAYLLGSPDEATRRATAQEFARDYQEIRQLCVEAEDVLKNRGFEPHNPEEVFHGTLKENGLPSEETIKSMLD